jgi:glycosyltransferase involved in cell wall biosynthesis
MDRLDVSVIIPARNAAGLLPACLDSVFASRGVTFEVIVVNDASTDDTERVARDRGCRVVSLEAAIMSANCRNLGAHHARGELLVFFDADERMAPDTLRRFADVLRAEPDVAAVVGSLTADTPAPGFFSQFKNLQHHYTHQTAAREGATLDSGRLAIRRQVFETLGGFEPAFGPASIEDIALGYRMRRQGYRIRFEPSIQVVHLKRYTFAGLVHSDVVHRAIPWTGLMLRERIFRNDLNTRGGNVASVVLAWLAAAALAGGALLTGWLLWAAAAAVILIGAANAAFLRVCTVRQGAWFGLRAAAFLPVMYFYQGVGLLAGVYAYLRGRSVARTRVPPSPAYRVFEPRPRGGA